MRKFPDRKTAALELARALKKYKGKNAIVLGIPRGGAETAYYVAEWLGADFSLIVCRKLGHPYNPEYAFGAIAEDGTTYIYPPAANDVSQEDMNRVIGLQKTEIRRRIEFLRKGKPLPGLAGKTVIIADDGIATGATIIAAARMCKARGASRVVLAAPVAASSKIGQLQQEADEVVVLKTPELFFAVSEVYDSFSNLNDSEALYFMNKWNERKRPSIIP